MIIPPENRFFEEIIIDPAETAEEKQKLLSIRSLPRIG
jgi:hypothetical protein